ncbi:MAG: ArsA family ATPase [Desulfobacteraceae bacterium]
MNRAMNLFFMGKGGVGKSTSAALFSTFLAQQGYRVLVVSLDPAHNQSDIFERPLSDDASEISPNLRAMEVDQEAWIRTYLKDVHHQIDRTYSYLTSFNLEKYFGVIKHSPGLEEYALILAFEHIQKQYAQWDYLIFDMPPTALSLKFFALPSLSLVWVEHLLALRQEIIQKRELITKITLLNKEFQRDKVLNKIEAQRTQYQKLKQTFEDINRTQVYLVLNPDKLSHAESLRIYNSLQEIDVTLYRTVYNKRPVNGTCAQVDPVFSSIPMISFPLSDTPLIGMKALEDYLRENQQEMETQLQVC